MRQQQFSVLRVLSAFVSVTFRPKYRAVGGSTVRTTNILLWHDSRYIFLQHEQYSPCVARFARDQGTTNQLGNRGSFRQIVVLP